MFKKTTNYLKKTAKSVLSSGRLKTLAFILLVGGGIALAQNSAGDYTAGTTALTTVTEEIAKYVPIVVKLCYAIAGVVAVVGAISVYIAMNNEEQDVKNILVLRNAFEKIRKQMKANILSINVLIDNLNFPMFAELTLKKTSTTVSCFRFVSRFSVYFLIFTSVFRSKGRERKANVSIGNHI